MDYLQYLHGQFGATYLGDGVGTCGHEAVGGQVHSRCNQKEPVPVEYNHRTRPRPGYPHRTTQILFATQGKVLYGPNTSHWMCLLLLPHSDHRPEVRSVSKIFPNAKWTWTVRDPARVGFPTPASSRVAGNPSSKVKMS